MKLHSHIVFAPKYRRKTLYYQKRKVTGKILRKLYQWKGVKWEKAVRCDKFRKLNTKYRNRKFCCKSYYVDTAVKMKIQ